jgi:hypothetical protein
MTSVCVCMCACMVCAHTHVCRQGGDLKLWLCPELSMGLLLNFVWRFESGPFGSIFFIVMLYFDYICIQTILVIKIYVYSSQGIVCLLSRLPFL